MKCQRAPPGSAGLPIKFAAPLIGHQHIYLSPSALPFNSLILLVIWSVSPTRHPSTNHLSSSEQWTIQDYRLVICAKIGRIGKAHQPFTTSQTCWTVGKCVCVCVCVCVRASVFVCDVIDVREKLALCLVAVGEHWTVLQRRTSSQTAHSQCDFIKGGIISFHHPIKCLSTLWVSHFDLPFFSFFVLLQK